MFHGHHGASASQVSFPARRSPQHGRNYGPRVSGKYHDIMLLHLTMIDLRTTTGSRNLSLTQSNAGIFILSLHITSHLNSQETFFGLLLVWKVCLPYKVDNSQLGAC